MFQFDYFILILQIFIMKQQKQKIYFSLKMTFQKQSESLTVKNLRDRKVIQGRQNIRKLRKDQQNTEKMLMCKKYQFEKERKKIILQNQRLKQQQRHYTEKLLKCQVKKDLILSQVFLSKIKTEKPQLFENNVKKQLMPQTICPIVKKYVNVLQSYIHGFGQEKIYKSARKLQSIKTYYLMRRITQRAQICFFLRPILRQNIGLYRLQFQKQKVIVSQRQKSQELVVISVYNIQGEHNFHYEVSYNPLKQNDQIEVPPDNPLKNLVIMKAHNRMYSLKEYLHEFYPKFITNVKKLQFKIHMAKQRRNLVYFKVLSIDHFFQKKYCDFIFEQKHDLSVKNLFLDVLVTVRRNQNDTIITIQTIRYNQNPNFTFIIRQKVQPRLAKNFNLETYFQHRIISLRKKTCIKIIDFNKNEQKLIKIQSFAKKMIKLLEYNQKKQNGQLNMQFHRIYNQKSYILITGINHEKPEKRRSYPENTNNYLNIVKKASIEEPKTIELDQQKQFKVFFECLTLKNHVLMEQYPKKYWKLCKNIIWITNMNTVTEARDTFVSTIGQAIKQYEEQQKKIQMLKPQKYRNRLRRFFINLFLRSRARRNVKYCKILKCRFGNFVLIIRKSPFYKGILNVNLYKLSPDQVFSTSQENNISGHYNIKIAQKFLAFAQKKEKHCYQTIYIFDDYFKSFKNAQEQFYFDRQYFLLKPKKKQGQHYIERIVPIDIDSEEVVKQFAVFKLQNGFYRTQNRKQSFMLSHQSIVSSASFPKQNQYRKCGYIIEQNAHGSVIYYSLLKDKDKNFYLDLFTVLEGEKKGDQELQLSKRQLLNKKDLMESNWTFIYYLVAKWVVNNCKLETQPSQKNFANSNILGFPLQHNSVYGVSRNSISSMNSMAKDQIISKTSLQMEQ